MKPKSLVVLLLAGIWGVGSWWWYTCKIKGFCGAETAHQTAAAVTTNTASTQTVASATPDTTTDSDGDGIPDSQERELGLDPTKADTDNDGVADGIEAKQSPADTDADGKIDPLDDDDDGDGVLTSKENPDPNGDGKVDDAADTNANQIPDYLEKAADGSTLTTTTTTSTTTTTETTTVQADTDAKAKADADAAAAKAKADEEAAKATAEADAAKAQAEADAAKAKADAEAAAQAAEEAAKAKADAEAAAAKAKAEADTITMDEAAPTPGTDIGPATLHFPTGSAKPKLAANADAYFKEVVQFLKNNPNATVTIVGHTDNVGKPANNQRLGQERADALKKILVSKGAPSDRIKTDSKGDTDPIASNDTEQGRKDNRRVLMTPVK